MNPSSLDSLGRLPAGVGEQLADNLPVPVDTRQQEVVDEGDRPPVALLGHHTNRRIPRLLYREDARPVVASVGGLALPQSKELLHWPVIAFSGQRPEHP